MLTRTLLLTLLSATLLAAPVPAAHAQSTPASVSANHSLSGELPSDLVKGNATVNLKIKLPDGDTDLRGLNVRVTAMTVSNEKMKVMEWPFEGKTDIKRDVERASTIVVTAWRTGPKPLRQSKVLTWRAKLPADAKPKQTDVQPVTLDWTIDMVPLQTPKPAEQAQDFDMAFKLDGKQFNLYALWLTPATPGDSKGKAELVSFKNLAEAKAGLTARKVTSAIILRANETDSDPDPVKQITMYSAGVRNAMCPTTFTLWATNPDDGLLLVRRVSEVKNELGALDTAPTEPGLYRRQNMFKLKDIGDFSTANKAPVLGPTLFGRLDGKYFKLRLGLMELTETPESQPVNMKLRLILQGDGTPNLPGE
jgi:hypothetical protein